MTRFTKNANQFLQKVFSPNARTENGAISHASTGSALLDYFSKCSTYRNRSLYEVSADMKRVWKESPEMALQMVFYNRLITRKVNGFTETESVQKGQGNRSEFRQCIIWLVRNKPDTLYKNLWLIPVVGTWKDLWHEELIDKLNHDKVYALIADGLKDAYNMNLLAKYLPRIRSASNTYNERHMALNDFAKGLAKYLKWSPVQYRKFKASGKAHDFQKVMCANKWNALQFDRVPGKALFQLVNNKGYDQKTTIERHDLEVRYTDWIMNQPTAKFTGYVHELMAGINHDMTVAQELTIDRQFDGLIALASQEQKVTENVWCALDTSGSMQAPVANTSAYNICISLGIYFSALNRGAFKDQVIMFDNESRSMQLKGSFTDKVRQIENAKTAWGSTNFQSVIDEIVHIRTLHPHVPLSDYPTTLIVVSDMQFDPVGGNTQTNYERAMQKLEAVGLPKMRIVWWYVTGRGTDFPNQMNDEGVTLIGGFDGSVISLLLGDEPAKSTTPGSNTPYQAMQKALNQPILQHLKI